MFSIDSPTRCLVFTKTARAASTTLDIYGHLMPSDTDRIRNAVDLAFRNPEDSSRTPEAESAW